MQADKHLELLGHTVRDKVTGYTGIVQGINFELYGCIQADVRPNSLDKDGKIDSGFWFDLNRLELISKEPILTPPNFKYGHIAQGNQGCDIKTKPESRSV